ncbi:MAG: ribonuclease E/G, partial [Lachnospiraceae bacterium]
KNALLINKEAIFEVFRQMRLRCLSGVVLVDLINMNDPESRREALSLAKELAVGERVKTEAVDITPLGILEIIRKKSGPTLFETLSSRQ